MPVAPVRRMRKAPWTLVAALAMLVPVLSGCSGPATPPAPPAAHVLVVDANARPVANALVLAWDDKGTQLGATHANALGEFDPALLPAGFDHVVASAPGGPSTTIGSPLPATIQLDASRAGADALAFLPHVDLVCTQPDQVPGAADCGQFGEPVVEVAGDGTIWASATCCIGKAPPIWVSRDGGMTFPQMRNTDTGLVRDSFGIEGDFAIDDAGNVYFFDISAATMWFTSYKADGTHRWTVPWVGEPAVDRPWVRAGAENEVWMFYNTGSSTDLYASTDGGMTWSATPVQAFPCGLGNPGQGPTRHDLYMAAACGDKLTVWTSRDGGATWDDGQDVPPPEVPYSKAGGRGFEVMNPPVADEAGNLYLPYTHFVDAKNTQNAVFVARRDAGGNWTNTEISQRGLNHLPWGAAGRSGHVGLAWYYAAGTFAKESSAEWHLMAAATVDADMATAHYQTTVADPDVLLKGNFGRNLGDFIETDLTPDGRMVVVYAGSDGSTLTDRFVQTNGLLDLAPLDFKNGPHAAP